MPERPAEACAVCEGKYAGHVLIVERDRDAREVMSEIVQEESPLFPCMSASYQDARARLAHGCVPRAIVVEVGGVATDGAALLRDIRADARSQGFPVLVVTTLPDADVPPGGDAVLHKPFTIEELLAALADAIHLRSRPDAPSGTADALPVPPAS